MQGTFIIFLAILTNIAHAVTFIRNPQQVFKMAPVGLDLNKLAFGFEMGRMSSNETDHTIVMDVNGQVVPFATFQRQFDGDDEELVPNPTNVNWDQHLNELGYNNSVDYFTTMYTLLTGIPPLDLED